MEMPDIEVDMEKSPLRGCILCDEEKDKAGRGTGHGHCLLCESDDSPGLICPETGTENAGKPSFYCPLRLGPITIKAKAR